MNSPISQPGSTSELAHAPSWSCSTLRVSRYDLLNSSLIAAILIASALFLMLAVMVFLPTQKKSGPGGILIDDFTTKVESELEVENVDPSLADAPDLENPVVDVGQFDQVSESLSSVRAAIPGKGGFGLGEDGHGEIDRRRPAPPGIDSPSSRWKISYELSDLDRYSAQLRFFEIELGLVSQSKNEILRVGDIGKTNLVVHSNRSLEAESTYFVPLDEAAKRFDRKLIRMASLDQPNTLIVHFYPNSTLNLLRDVEHKSLPNGKKIEHVEQTSFQLIPRGSGFDVRVERFEFK